MVQAIGIGIGTAFAQRTGSSTPAAPGATPTTFALAPTVHYHPHSQAGSVTKDGSNRITACPDLMGLAGLTSAATGPTEMTDGLGRKFWRFTGSDALIVADALAGISARATGLFIVARVHKHRYTTDFFRPRYATYVGPNDAGNTAPAATTVTLQARLVSNGTPSLNQIIGTDTVNGFKMVPPCNLACSGGLSRTTALGGQRFYLNGDTAVNPTQSGATTTGMRGGIIGGTPATPNTVSASNIYFDLYEFAFWNASLTDPQGDAISAAMVANWGLAAFTSQLVLEGDSITDGIPTTLTPIVTSADNIGMVLSAPGSTYQAAHPNRRILNHAASGGQTSNLVARRDAAQCVFGPATAAGKYPGGPANNKVAPQIGRNDVTAKTAATLYADNVAVLNNSGAGTEGYLQRGWSVVQVANIAGPNTAVGGETIQGRLEAFRAMIADTTNHLPLGQFLTDTLSNTGQTYEGLVTVLHLYDVTLAGDYKFKTASDTSDTSIYDDDLTHLMVAGHNLMVSGGDTPQYAYGSIS